jgi:hypothetical protein
MLKGTGRPRDTFDGHTNCSHSTSFPGHATTSFKSLPGTTTSKENRNLVNTKLSKDKLKQNIDPGNPTTHEYQKTISNKVNLNHQSRFCLNKD